MTPRILSLHHVTATVDDAQQDLDFFRTALGLRLVKKTVNFDNHHVYHFYYGDATGAPGTLFTTFPYKGHGVGRGERGAGQVTATAFSVPVGTIGSWRARLASQGLRLTETSPRFGARCATCDDASGLRIEFVEAEDERLPWSANGVVPDLAVRGLHSVTLLVRSGERSVRFLTDLLGLTPVASEGNRTRLAAGSNSAGHWFDVVDVPDAAMGRNGLGTVHHVAMAIATDDAQLAAREALVGAGIGVTPVRDRQYFRSIYFREPGGVLYEIATLAPGFDVDEPLAALGTSLKLPPWEEPFRVEIEGGLPAIDR